MIKVELLAARIPGLPGIIADHHWFLIRCDRKEHKDHSYDRWEVWQHPYQNDSCWGYLHKNLLRPYQGVGNGSSRLIRQWVGDEALFIVRRIEASPKQLPIYSTICILARPEQQYLCSMGCARSIQAR